MKVVCNKCKEEKEAPDFYKDNRRSSGLTTVCKDCHLEYSKEYKTSLTGRYKDYKLNAKKKGLVFQLSKEEFNTITSQPCHYCGSFTAHDKDKGFVGVDRVNNSQGYIPSNIVPCCRNCNYMKKDLASEVFLKHIEQIYFHQETAKSEEFCG